MNYKIFDRFSLKIIMIIFMVFDHIAQFIPNTPYWFHWLGRVVAPVFFFLLTEGYDHTRDRVAYMNRLFTWAGIMFLGNGILYLIFKRKPYIFNNIFFSMALGIALLITLGNRRNMEGREKTKNTLLIILILFFSSFAEGSLMSTAMVLIFHYLKEDRVKMSLAYIILSVSFFPNPQWMMVFALPFILMYNGKKGKDIKYFFYIFYPLHIWVLYIIGFFMGR
ncbi:MAG: conjugal transfer protein TraX [Tissierellia bacterium]|nr:conjugal transfer protein TraX [Tissierellia bacterium]